MELDHIAGARPYRSPVEQLPVVTYAARLTDRMRLIYVSAQVERLTGFPAEQWLGDSDLWFRQAHPDDRQRVFAAARSRVDEPDREIDIEYRVFTRDGDTVWVRDQSTSRHRDDGDGVVIEGMLTDVTALREARESIARSAVLHRSILDALHEGIIVVDAAGMVVDANPSARRLIGFDPLDAAGTPWWERLSPRDGDGRPLEIGSTVGATVAGTGRRAVDVPMRITDAQGDERLLALNYEPFGDAGGEAPAGLVVSFRDITDEQRAREELVATKERYEAQFRGLPVPTYAWRREDDDFVLVDSNEAARVLTEGQIDALFGSRASDVHRDDPEIRLDLERCFWNRRSHTRAMTYCLRSTGEVRELVVTYVFAPPDFVLAHTLDVTERVAGEQRLRELAEHDSLTGLFNRRHFEAVLAEHVGHSACAVVLVDVDHFKFVNDSLGHAAGDELLRAVATAMRDRVRPGDVVARLGGDEFAVLLADADEGRAAAVAGHLLAAIRSQLTAVTVSASAGVAAFEEGVSVEPSEALVAADLALYQAKESGRDRVALFGGTRGTSLTWLDRVRAAIDEERLVLHAQPILDLRTGETAMEELLVRMVDEHGVVVPPASFLPTAEQFGLIRDIDRWVIRRGIEHAATSGRRVDINLSARSLADLELPSTIAEHLRRTGADPATVRFEYTETAAVSSVEDACSFTQQLNDMGCSVALDDFGTGFGTLILLKHLPISTLKIDMEFVRSLSTSVADQRIVRSIVHIASEAGLSVIAEGVEDEGALALLRDYGVDFAQGFHIGRPAPL